MSHPWRIWVAGALFAVFALAALVGWLFPPFDPLQPDLGERLLSPGTQGHLLGTDNYGRDALARLMAASAMSLYISISAILFAGTLGGVIGGVAGYFGGWTDRLLSVVIDAMLSFPGILLALALSAVLGAGPFGMILALGIAFSPAVARQFRAAVMGVRSADYVEAGLIIGQSRWTTFRRDILPNSLTPVIVLLASLLSAALLTESALSFLGIGVQPPTPTWGNMLAEGRRFLVTAPWLSVFPGLAITLAAFAINIGGDALRDILDPRMRISS